MVKIEKSVIEKFMGGDTAAFHFIYDSTKSFVYNVIYKMTFNEHETQDLVQDVYVKMFEKRSSYKPTAEITTWLYRIAFNHVLNIQRRKKWLINNMKDMLFMHNYNNEELDSDEGPASQALNKLDAHYRMPIVLKDIEEMSYEEVATILNIKVGTVRSRLNRGRTKLKEMYEKEAKKDGV